MEVGERRDAAVAVGDEVVDAGLDGARVVEHDVRERAAGGEVVDLHHRHAAAVHAQHVVEVPVAVRAAEDQARHAVAGEGAQVRRLDVVAVLVVGHDHAVAALADAVDDRAGELREERLDDAADHQADRGGVAAAQRRGQLVRLVVQGVDRLPDPPQRVGRELAGFADRPLGGGGGDAGAAGDLLDGGHETIICPTGHLTGSTGAV